MSKISGSKESYGLGAEYNDLDTDAVPDLPLPDWNSAGLAQKEPSSTAYSAEIPSGSIRAEQQEKEKSPGEQVVLLDEHQTEQRQRPDGSSPLLADSSQPQRTKLTRQQSSQIKGDTDYQIFLPPALRQSQLDILIIYSEEDKPAAEKLKKTIEKLHAECTVGEKIPITVALTEEVAVYVRSNIEWLDAALSCCTYIFVVFTQHLTNDPVLSEMTRASLWATFSEEKKNKFCPIYLERGAKEALQLSIYINQLSSINLWKDYKAQIEKYIDVAPRLERSRQQVLEIQEYCEQWKNTAAHSNLVENRCHKLEFHKNQVSPTASMQQPPVSSAMDSGFLGETAPVQNTDITTDNSGTHSSHVDSKSCYLKPESCNEQSILDGKTKIQALAKGEPCTEVKNSPQTSRDNQMHRLLILAFVIGAGLLFLFRKKQS